MSTHAKVSTKGGCGCGGEGGLGGSKAGGCSCGGHTACLEPAAYVRPRFFPGQLLTEDDLELVVDYASAKNRLHNRFLFGDGVVCGLKVTCDPCGGGRVKVSGGYALDCCGNDIVVPCSVDLDINRMVRDLLRARGMECGAPCPEPKPHEAAVWPRLPAPASPAGAAVESIEVGRQYCLYVRYCEHPTEPVAPYTTDDPCSAQACQFSRVEEGYAFELRCPGEEPEHRDMLETLDACIGPFHRIPPLAILLRVLRSRAVVLAAALERAPEPDQAKLDGKDLNRFVTLTKQTTDEPMAEMSVIEEMAAIVTRIELADATAAGRAMLAAAAGPKIEEMRPRVIERARALRERPDYKELEAGGIERTVIADVLDTVNKQMDAANRPTGWKDLFAVRLLAGGFALSPAAVDHYRGYEAELRGRLSGAIGGRISDCRLPMELAELQPLARAPQDITKEYAADLHRRFETIDRVAGRLVLDCFCGSVLPECAPCEDPVVLLACLRVEDCRVIEVCNLVRRFVLAPATVRYWGGVFLEQLGNRLERLCCGPREDIKPVTIAPDRMARLERAAEILGSASGRADISAEFADPLGVRAMVDRALSAVPSATAAGLSPVRRGRVPSKKKGGT